MSDHPYVRLLRRNVLLLVLAVLIGSAAGAAASVFQSPSYRATAQIFVSLNQASNVQDLSQGNTFAQQAVKSYSTVVSTPVVLQPVIAKLHLSDSTSQLADKISVDNPLNTVVLDINVSYGSAVKAANIANEVSAQLARVVRELTPSSSNSNSSPVTVSVITPATPPIAPAAPRPVLYVGIAAVLALFAVLIYLLARDRFDVRVRSRADLEATTPAPILGSFQYDRSALLDGPVRALSENGALSEANNQLRTSLQFFNARGQMCVIAVTSSTPGEGKTTSALGLALSLARAGRRAVLIDADLRRPRVAEYAGLDGSLGLTDVLVNLVELSDAIQSTNTQLLDVLPAGTIPPNPAELLQSVEMVNVVGALRQMYDYVIVDVPPLLPVADARVLAQVVDGFLVVVSAKKATRPQVLSAMEYLGLVEGRILGFALTMLPRRGPDAYGGYYGYEVVPGNVASSDENSPRSGKNPGHTAQAR